MFTRLRIWKNWTCCNFMWLNDRSHEERWARGGWGLDCEGHHAPHSEVLGDKEQLEMGGQEGNCICGRWFWMECGWIGSLFFNWGKIHHFNYRKCTVNWLLVYSQCLPPSPLSKHSRTVSSNMEGCVEIYRYIVWSQGWKGRVIFKRHFWGRLPRTKIRR